MEKDSKMLHLSAQLLAQLNRSKVRYLHWKGNHHFLNGLNGIGDVDLLVHRDDATEVRNLLKACGFKRFKTQKYMLRDSVEDWIGCDHDTGKLIHCHLHFQMVFGKNLVNEYSFVPYDICFDTAVIRDNCKLQNPVWEYILLLCRICTGNLTEKKIENNMSYLKGEITESTFRTQMNRADVPERTVQVLLDLFSSQDFMSDVLEIDKGGYLDMFMHQDISNATIRYYWRTMQYRICNFWSRI